MRHFRIHSDDAIKLHGLSSHVAFLASKRSTHDVERYARSKTQLDRFCSKINLKDLSWRDRVLSSITNDIINIRDKDEDGASVVIVPLI